MGCAWLIDSLTWISYFIVNQMTHNIALQKVLHRLIKPVMYRSAVVSQCTRYFWGLRSIVCFFFVKNILCHSTMFTILYVTVLLPEWFIQDEWSKITVKFALKLTNVQ